MLNELEQVKPADIEKRSFEIITEELGDKILTPGRNRSLSDASTQARILTMRTIWSFPARRWRKRWRRSGTARPS